MFIPCISSWVFNYTHPIHQSLFNNFTFSILISTDNTIFLLSISKRSRSFPLLFPFPFVPIFLPFRFSHSSHFTSKIYQSNFIIFPTFLPVSIFLLSIVNSCFLRSAKLFFPQFFDSSSFTVLL